MQHGSANSVKLSNGNVRGTHCLPNSNKQASNKLCMVPKCLPFHNKKTKNKCTSSLHATILMNSGCQGAPNNVVARLLAAQHPH
jgi:hypothetical protein